MKAVVQRVSRASVTVEGVTIGSIHKGLLVLLGVGHEDTTDHAKQMAGKISRLRIFEDNGGKMNLSVQDTGGSVFAISQFTLLADTKKGNRPSFINAARPEIASPLYERFCDELSTLGIEVKKGRFGAHMEVSLINDGPVTIELNIPPRD